nr:putative TonB-dependent receptor [Raoultella sp. NCTC 9187]
MKSEGSWQKWDVTLASPSKATAWVGWAPDPWSLRVQTQQVFDLSDASGNKLDGYNTVDFIGSYALPLGKLTFSIENLLNEDYVTIWASALRCSTAQPTAAVRCMSTKAAAAPLV